MVDVTVIMPAFDAAPFIEAAILSVLNQSYHDLELIVIDDGSTDQTCHILQRLEKRDARIRTIAARHEGVAAARNRGLSLAKGRWISFLDADDLWPSKRLARHIEILKRDPALAVVCGHVTLFEALASDGGPSPRSRHLTLLGTYLAAATFCRGKMERVGSFDTTLSASEDLDLFLRYYERGEKFYIESDVALLHRRHATNMTRDADATRRSIMTALAYAMKRRRAPGFVMPSEKFLLQTSVDDLDISPTQIGLQGSPS